MTARQAKVVILDLSPRTCRLVHSGQLSKQVTHGQAGSSLLLSTLANRYLHPPSATLAEHLAVDDNMADKEATTNGSFESSVDLTEANLKSHTSTNNSPNDLEKADFNASPPSESPETTITAQDWTGPNDPENPQNW